MGEYQGTKINLDRERTWFLDLNAIRAFKRATGKSLMRGGLKPDEMDEDDLCALIWAGLLYEDPNVTLDQVGHAITISNMAAIAEDLGRAFEAVGLEGGLDPTRSPMTS